MTDRKLKKRLRKEADTLMQAKKEDMLSFYQPTEEKRARGRRFPVRALIAASLVVVLLAVVVFAVSLNSSSPAVDPSTPDSPSMPDSPSLAGSEPATVSESSAEPPIESDPSAAFDIAPWNTTIYTPYAVAEIVEVTEETVRLHSRYNGCYTDSYESTKIICRILYAYRAGYFDKPFNYMGVDVDNYVPFEELQEIYVASKSVGELKEQDRIFFQPTDMYVNGHVYYGPLTDFEGQAEYLPFIDGKIHMTEEALETDSFDDIWEVNQEVKDLLDSANRGHTSELIEASPKFVFEGELDLAQIEEFFQGCKALAEAFDKRFNGCCVVYDPEGW